MTGKSYDDLKKQIMDYHQLEETCAQMGQRLPQR